jgi:hypothetical protein
MEKNSAHWREPCEQASVEQDPEKLRELVAEINRLLDEKQARPADKGPKELTKTS